MAVLAVLLSANLVSRLAILQTKRRKIQLRCWKGLFQRKERSSPGGVDIGLPGTEEGREPTTRRSSSCTLCEFAFKLLENHAELYLAIVVEVSAVQAAEVGAMALELDS